MTEPTPPVEEKDQRTRLPRNVIALGAVSLLMDASTEMIRPIFPLLLRSLGAPAVVIGLIEGAADTLSSLLKLAAGWVSDQVGKRKPLIVFGYGASAIAKPIIALCAAPWQAGFAWLFDRTGKGVRGSPRDAIIADSTPQNIRGRAYGLHRAMDSAGAALGPLLGMGLIWYAVQHKWAEKLAFRSIFWLAAVPGVLAVFVVLAFVREVKPQERAGHGAGADGPKLGTKFAWLMVVLAVFSLGNSADAFLMLRAKDLLDVGKPEGLKDVVTLAAFWVSAMYVGMNLVYAALSHPFGALSDRVGRRPLVVWGFVVYALAYAGFAEANAAWQLWPLFGIYGIYYAMTDGAVRALVADLVAPEVRGTAFGIQQFVSGILLLPASVGMGWLYDRIHGRAFYVGAALALVSALGIQIVFATRKKRVA